MVFGLLASFLVGIPLLIALAVANAGCAVVGGLKARAGIVWRYPYAFEVFKDRGTDGTAVTEPS